MVSTEGVSLLHQHKLKKMVSRIIICRRHFHICKVKRELENKATEMLLVMGMIPQFSKSINTKVCVLFLIFPPLSTVLGNGV